MLKQTIKHSFFYSISTFLSAGISIILVPIYTRVFIPGDYGTIDLLNAFGGFIRILIALEITQAIARYLPDTKTAKEKSEFYSTALIFTTFTHIAFVLLTLPFANILAKNIFGNNSTFVISMAIVSVMTNGILYFIQIQLRFLLKTKEYIIISILNTILVPLFSIIFIIVLKWGIAGVFIGQIIGNFVSIGLAFFFSLENFIFVFKIDKIKSLLRFSLPLLPAGLTSFIALYSDRILIKQYLNLDAVGIYGIGYRFASTVSLVVIGFKTALLPLVFQNYKDKQTPIQMARIFNYFIFFTLIFLLSLSLFSKEILILFTTPRYYSASLIIPLLTISVVINELNIFTVGLLIVKRTKMYATINILSVLINIILNLIFIPKMGILGSGVATILSSLFGFLLNYILSQKNYYVPYEWKKIFLSSIIIMFLYSIAYLPIPFNLLFLIKFLVILLAIILISIILIGINDLLTIYKKIANLKKFNLLKVISKEV